MKWRSREISTLLVLIVLVGLCLATTQPVYSSDSEQDFFSQDLSSELLEQSGDLGSSQESQTSALKQDQSVTSQNEPQQDLSTQDLSSELLEQSGDLGSSQELQASTPTSGQSEASQDLLSPPSPLQDQLLLDLLAEPSAPTPSPSPQYTLPSGLTSTSGLTTSTTGLLSDTYLLPVSQSTTLTTPIFSTATQEVQQAQQAQAQIQAQQLQEQQLKAQAQLQAQQLQAQQAQAQIQTQQLQSQQLQAQAQLQAQQLQIQQTQAQMQAQQLQAQQLQAQQLQAQQLKAQSLLQPPVTQVIVPAPQAQLPRLTTAVQGPIPTPTPAPVQIVSQQSGPSPDIVKSSLVSILGDVTKSGTPSLLDANVISDSNALFNQAYLQDYPSFGSSIYMAIKNFYNNRTASSYGDMQILLKNAQDKAFLTPSQNDDLKNCLMQIREDVKSSLKAILEDPTKSGTPALLNANVVDVSSTTDSLSINLIPSFNQSYLQNYPGSGSSIYTAIQNFYNNRADYLLGDVQMLLTNAQTKAFLTPSQKSDLKSWGGRLIDEVKSALSTILKDKTKSGTPGLLNTNVVAHSTGMFNQDYLQNYPSASNSIYTAIKNFYNNRTSYPPADLRVLLNNALNKSFLSYKQNADLANWSMQLGIYVESANQASAVKIAEMTRVNNILSNFTVTASTYDSQLLALQELAKSVPANSEFDYKQMQPIFWMALTSLHNARPKTDKNKLMTLKAWYADATLKTSKLVATGKSFTTMNNDINSDLMNIIQSAEMTRVNNILNNFTVTALTYDAQLPVVQNLVTSITANYNYAPVQASFWTALTNLHNARPKTDKVRLEALKAWYAKLVSSKLISATNNLAVLRADVDSDFKMIDQAAIQLAEMTRVNNILKNFTVTVSTYDSQLPILPNLVTSIAANFQANTALDYTSVQAGFWTALTSLHNARPKTDKSKLTTLKTWYETLNTWAATLVASKLIATGKNFTTMINDINSDFANLVASAEMTRVNNILKNFTVTVSTYDSQLPILPNLVTSIAANFQANTALDYTPVQANFWAALTSLHNARPKADKTKLTTLKTWYETLNAWYATLTASKLVDTGKNFTTMINDVNLDLVIISQLPEMTRVNNILKNFTVTTSTYDSQLSILPNLVTSIVSNFQANTALDYTSVQATFWAALTSLHNARPKTNKTKLTTLKTWYETLNSWYATLMASKLVATGKSFTTMINDISSDIAKL